MALVVSPTPSFCSLPNQRLQVARHQNVARSTSDQYAKAFGYQEQLATWDLPYWEYPPLVTDFWFPFVDFGPTFTLSLNHEALPGSCYETAPLRLTGRGDTRHGRTRKRNEPSSRVKSAKVVKCENAARRSHTPCRLISDSPAGRSQARVPSRSRDEVRATEEPINPTASNEDPKHLSSFDDILFSSTEFTIHGTSHETTDLCGLCHKPFETGDQDSLRRHLKLHMDQLCGELVCQVCQLGFTHRRDLEWHQLCARQGQSDFHCKHSHPRPKNHALDVHSDPHHSGCTVSLRQWEQAELKAYKRGINAHVNRLNFQPRSRRANSVPPRPKRDFEIVLNETISPPTSSSFEVDELESKMEPAGTSLGSLDSSDKSDVREYKAACEANLPMGLKGAVMDLQSRVRDLVQQLQPSADSTPKSRLSENGESLDFESMDGESPIDAQRLSTDDDISPDSSPGRARSEPPPRMEGFGELSFTQNSPESTYTSSAGGPSSGGLQASYSNSRGQKRSNDNDQSGRDPNDRGNDDDSGGWKRLKSFGTGPGDREEKKFPCVCHIGEPERFSNDTTRHKHISNLCRHLKRHNFYACSTCILQFANDEELDNHLVSHIKSCRMKGCRRQRWAFEPEPAQCKHITSSEDQWRKLFSLKYGRAAPADAFDVDRDMSTPMSRIDSGVGSIDVGRTEHVGSSSNADLFPSGWENTMEPSGSGPDAILPPLDWDSWILPNPTIDSNLPPQDILKACAAPTPEILALKTTSTAAEDASIHRTVQTLLGQVVSLEKAFDTRGAQNMDRIFTLQSQVAQLEQQLFQSSTRERQLEATLGVVFDAFQATGAEKAQRDQPIWNLVASQSSKGLGGSGSSATVAPDTPIPAPSIDTANLLRTVAKGKQSVPAASDSAYGSF